MLKKLDRAFLRAKLRFEELVENEDGLETVETVILVIVAIVIALGVINVLTGEDGKSGIISQIGDLIITKIKSAFGIEG